MYRRIVLIALAFAPLTAIPISNAAAQQPEAVGFFVTSVGSGNGGDLGGLAGADKHCQTLAAAAGAGNSVARSISWPA